MDTDSHTMIPQIIYLLIIFIGLLIASNEHGKDKKGKHNFWTTLIAASLVLYLLYWGGFFDVILKR